MRSEFAVYALISTVLVAAIAVAANSISQKLSLVLTTF